MASRVLILSHHSGFSVTCECNEEEINDDDDVWLALPAETKFESGTSQSKSGTSVSSGKQQWSRQDLDSEAGSYLRLIYFCTTQL